MTDHLLPTDHIKNGFMFPNVTEVQMMDRATGETRTKSLDSMQKKLSAPLFKKIKSELSLWGEYKQKSFHMVVSKQSDYC
jgi:hypothetical protein